MIDSNNLTLYKGLNNMATLSGFTQGQLIKVRIQARNEAGSNNPSDEYQFIIAGSPDPPINLSVKSITNTQVVLTWLLPANDGGSTISNYMIYRQDLTNNSIINLIATISSTNLTYTDYSVISAQSCYYYVKAGNSISSSDFSNSVFVTPLSIPSGFSAVTPQLITRGDSYLVIGWSNVPLSGGSSNIIYNLYYKCTKDINYINAYRGSSLSYMINGLTNGNNYVFKVQAENEIGLSDFSNESISITCGTISSPPINLVLTSRGQDSFCVSWSPPINTSSNFVNGYLVYTSIDNSNSKIKIRCF